MSNIDLNSDDLTIAEGESYTDWLTEMADIIREKTDTTEPIKPVAFPTKMREISGGGLFRLSNNVNSAQFEFTEIPQSFWAYYGSSIARKSAFLSNASHNYLTGDATSIASSAFSYGSTNSEIQYVTDLSFRHCKVIGGSVFAGFTRLKTASFPECTSIGNYAFSGAYLSEIYAPKCETIGTEAFHGTHLVSVTLGSPITIGMSAFDYQSNMTSGLTFDKCITIGSYAFNRCTNFSVPFDAPNCTNVTTGDTPIFAENYGIPYIYLPMLSAIYSSYGMYRLHNKFAYMYGLEFAYINYPGNISSGYVVCGGTFRNCSNLKNVVLRNVGMLSGSVFLSDDLLSSIFLWHDYPASYTSISSGSMYNPNIATNAKIVVPESAYDLQVNNVFASLRSQIMSMPEAAFKARVKELVDEYRGIDTPIWGEDDSSETTS